MTLSQRIARLDSTTSNMTSLFERDLRVVEMQVARAEEKLLRLEKQRSSWTRPDLRLRLMEDV